ncbi:MAG: hypothetical protein NVSMB68_03250 [Thermoanaerobaculia bacterium]
MRWAILILGILIATLIVQAVTAPTFDFDEALYRRVAEEMKNSHEYFVTTWDGRPFYEKPPTYFWTIVLSSVLFDGSDSHVSIFAARFPSLIFSILTIASLAWFWRRSAPRYAEVFGLTIEGTRRWLLSPLLPVLAYGSGIFAIGGASGVVLDPMLTLCLLGPLFAFSSAFLRGRSSRFELTHTEFLMAAGGMAAAVAVKGLIGVALPALALALHALLEASMSRWTARSARQIGALFLTASLAAALFYLFLYQCSGRAFLYEFFVRQHFLRATKVLQGHGGSLLFHLAVVLLLGGPLVAFVTRGLRWRGRSEFAQWGFPLTWTAALIIFYSAVATKLPNYTWPVWPALALALCVTVMRSQVDGKPAPLRTSRWPHIIAPALVLPAALLLIVLGAGVERWWHPAAATRAGVMLSAIEPLPLSVRAGLLIAGLAMAMQVYGITRFGRRIDDRSMLLWRSLASATALNCAALIALSLAVLPIAGRLLRGPLVRLSREASLEHVKGGDLITVGLFSPTVSSNYEGGPIRQLGHLSNRDPLTSGQHLVLVPMWRLGVCGEPGFTVIGRDGFLTLCEKRIAPRLQTQRADARCCDDGENAGRERTIELK